VSLARLISAPMRPAESPRPAAPPPYPSFRSMPPGAPQAMPVQDLSSGELQDRERNLGLALKRAVLLAGTGAATAYTAVALIDLLRVGGLSAVEMATVALSCLLCAWVAYGFISAVAGFFMAWTARAPLHGGVRPVIFTRTAILVPTYNEDPGRVLAAVQAMYEDLRRAGVAGLYDVFILSDTRERSVAKAEAIGVLRLRLRLGGRAGVYYRRRLRNTDKKAGNIADWVQGWGAAYESMLVLDADSLMSADAVVRMTAAMEADPRLGLLQTSPSLINAETPFARLHQFASWLYGPIFSLGQHWWSGSDGNYWGHNAIIRVRAFAESAGLPHLKGKPPFGGHIQSHDFVEAALLRRAGWSVRMWPALPGSYEETPPTLLDMACRDRRWCQGNLQHARLLRTAGLHWVSRLHLLRGVMSYLAAPMWLLLLICGSVAWPALHASGSDLSRLSDLFGLTMALLLVPKALALALALRDRRLRSGFGGTVRLLASAVFETAVSMLTAPILMMMQATAVFDVLLGRDSGWGLQARDEGDTTPRQAWRAHRAHVVLGVFGALAAAVVDTHLLVWTSPVFAGLALSSVLSIQTARADTGRLFGRLGLLRTPGETTPEWAAVRAAELRRAYAEQAGQRWEIERMMRTEAPVYQIVPIHAQRPVLEPRLLSMAAE